MLFGFTYEAGLRPVNQDAILLRCCKLSKGELSMAVICDGMGGEKGGEQASYECVRALDGWFDRELIPVFTDFHGNIYERMRLLKSKGFRIFYEINRTLFDSMRKKEGRPGTTASLLILYQNYFFCFHIGDSRIYFIRHFFGAVCFLCKTKDHAVGHRLTRCLGLNKEFEPDFCWGISVCRDYLMCTDGFWRKYDKEVWKSCLSALHINQIQMTKRLRELAKDNLRKGETDNISALWIRKESEHDGKI